MSEQNEYIVGYEDGCEEYVRTMVEESDTMEYVGALGFRSILIRGPGSVGRVLPEMVCIESVESDEPVSVRR